MTPSASQLSAISRLFSSAVFREMAKKGRSSMFARLFGIAAIEGAAVRHATVADGFDLAFEILRKVGLRDEYVYRAAIMRKHSLHDASMLTEFRAGSCKADLVVLNGTSTVYEIKSERDSLTRLASQVANYRKVFATVNVIASECHLDNILEIVPDDIGVMCLSRRHSIKTVRDGIDCPDAICPVTTFESLRTEEARNVLDELGVPIPAVPNTQLRTAMMALFAKQEPALVHRAVVATLKVSRNLAPLSQLVDRLPASLHAAALSIQIQQREHDRLIEAVSTPLTRAVAWA